MPATDREKDVPIDRRSLIPVLALVLVVGACGGDDDGVAPSDAVAPGDEARPVTLPEYLAIVLELDQASAVTAADRPNTAAAMAGYNWTIAAAYRDASNVLGAISPPAEASAHAGEYRALAHSGSELFSAAAEAFLSGEGVEATGLQIEEIAARSRDLALELQRLIGIALSDANDPLSSYLLASVELREDFALRYGDAIDGLQPLLDSNALASAAGALRAASEEFRGFLPAWDALEPPPQAERVHDLERALIVTVADIFSDMEEPIANDDQPAVQLVAERMAGFTTDAINTNRMWNTLLISVLRGL